MKTATPQALIDELEAKTALVITGADLTYGPYRYCDAGYNIPMGGYLFEASGFTFGKISAKGGLSVAEADFKIANADRLITLDLLNTDRRGEDVNLYFTALDIHGVPITSQIFFYGTLDDYKIDDSAVSFYLLNKLIRWRRKTLIKPSPTCHLRFKGTRCGYGGSETQCDRTYARCYALGNSDNFRGARWLAATSERKIQWGPKG